EKRVNGLGLSEANIYIADVADEKHIVVEMAQTVNFDQADVKAYLDKEKAVESLSDDEKKIVSWEKAKAAVGKTIQLEFKEEKAVLNSDEENQVREMASQALEKIKNGGNFEVIAQEESQAHPSKVNFQTS